MIFAERGKADKLCRLKEHSSDGVYVLIFGGRGYERSVSVQGALRLALAAEVRDDLALIYVDEVGSFNLWLADRDRISSGDLDPKHLLPIDIVMRCGVGGIACGEDFIRIKRAFPLLHGDYGEDGTPQGLLKSLGIPFVGADTLGSAVCCDKAYAKAAAMNAGVPTLPYAVIYEDDTDADALAKAKKIGYPVFIKPCRLGSSVGAHIARCESELESAIRDSRRYAKRLISEPALINKKEIECAYFSLCGENLIAYPGEVSYVGEFYDYNAKYGCKETKIYPKANIPKNVAERIMAYTASLRSCLSVRHIARFDYFLTESGEIYFNEVNTIPGMTEGSLYPAMLKESGIEFSGLAERLLFSEVTSW